MTSLVASAIQRVEAIVVAGPQNWNNGKRTQTLRQPLAQLSRHCIAIRKFAAVGLVDRPRRGAHVVARRHIVPPEHVGAGETGIAFLAGFPDLLATDEPIGLTPQQDFHLVAEQPAIANNAMVLRQSFPS